MTNTWGIAIFNFEIKLQSYRKIKNMVLVENRNTHQWNKIEDPNTGICNDSHLRFGKNAKTYIEIKDNTLSKQSLGDQISSGTQLSLDSPVTPYTNTRSKYIKGLNLKPEKAKRLEENIPTRDRVGKNFLNRTLLRKE